MTQIVLKPFADKKKLLNYGKIEMLACLGAQCERSLQCSEKRKLDLAEELADQGFEGQVLWNSCPLSCLAEDKLPSFVIKEENGLIGLTNMAVGHYESQDTAELCRRLKGNTPVGSEEGEIVEENATKEILENEVNEQNEELATEVSNEIEENLAVENEEVPETKEPELEDDHPEESATEELSHEDAQALEDELSGSIGESLDDLDAAELDHDNEITDIASISPAKEYMKKITTEDDGHVTLEFSSGTRINVDSSQLEIGSQMHLEMNSISITIEILESHYLKITAMGLSVELPKVA